jgi:hypothetical protein
MVKEMVTNCAVSFDGSVKKQALIMDEVDGMSGGDRGGVTDLISSIKARGRLASRRASVRRAPADRAGRHFARRRQKFPSSASATTGGAKSCGPFRITAWNCSSTAPPSSRSATGCCKSRSKRA